MLELADITQGYTNLSAGKASPAHVSLNLTRFRAETGINSQRDTSTYYRGYQRGMRRGQMDAFYAERYG